MVRRIVLVVVVSCAIGAGCGGGTSEETGVPEAVGDTQLAREAQSEANDLIRNAADCAAVEASYRGVVEKLDEIEGRIQTEAGRTTLETLRKQIANVADACGVR